MIRKFYEISCDTCSEGTHFEEVSKKRAKWFYRDEGGFITKEGKTYCGQKCMEEAKQMKETD